MKKIFLLFILFVVCFTQTVLSQTLIHYWNFNNSATVNDQLTPTSSIVGGAGIVHVAGGISAIQTTSNINQGFETTNPNTRNADVSGSHLRFNDPIGGALVFSLPATGYRDIIIKYGTRRSGSGAGTQVIEYTTDGTNYISFATVAPIDGNPTVQTLDFSAITAVNNNPDFKIKITFQQGGGGTVGNNRFDNFTSEGNPQGADMLPPVVTFDPVNNTTIIPVTTQPKISFSEDIRLADNSAIDNSNVDNLVELRLGNASGTLVAFDANVSGRDITIVPSGNLLNGQMYYVALKANVVEDISDNAVSSVQSSVFTTIVPQTVFAPGDLVVVAYRMNTTSTGDEVAILTLVDILPGTMINLTDTKYTDNATAQCPGGLVWTAPAGGVPVGTVIVIQNDASTASTGTVTGSSFGLSSSGDQVIFYTGSASRPSYITAFSSNAWVINNASCSGSSSKLPAGLADGVSAVNLSTSPGNVSGNSVNAYYTGTQTGTKSEIQTSVLNPANWTSLGSGTAAQTWPTWAFPGPPVVVSASVVNQTTLQVVFNRQLDNATATNIANYTGIAGISSVTRSSNGTLADTLTVNFSTPFSTGTNYTLSINNVKDTDNRVMFGTYSFNFIYNTRVSLTTKFISADESAGTVSFNIKLENPSVSSIDLVINGVPFSNAGASDYVFANQTLSFTGASNSTHTITIPITNDNVEEQTEYFVLSLQNAVGCTLTGSKYFTVFIRDNDRTAPQPTREIELSHVGSFEPVSVNGSTSEIVVHDPVSQRLFMTSAIQKRLDIANFSNPAAITLVTSIDMSSYGGITSVAVKNGVVAVTSPNANEQLDGSVVFFDTDGNFLKQVIVGALPDMIVFTPDGSKVLTANEGQPNSAYTVDPEGSVSVIDISGGIPSLTQANVTTITFTSFNANEAVLIMAGVRKTKLTSTLSQDLEPEYIAVSSNSTKAWVTLQENNSVAEINLQTNTVSDIWSLGTKNYNTTGNGFDASDNSGVVNICNWPIKGFYMPDGVTAYSSGGVSYIITANEGDEKEYSALTERTTVSNASVILDPTVFPNYEVLKEDHNMGRLRISNLQGDTDTDGDYDQLYMVGARSFSIWNADSKQLVYDSGDDFEMITSSDPSVSAIFNADNEGNGFKSRSRAKGPEPEGVTVAALGGKTYAFIALERVGGVMVYDVTDPSNPEFVDYKNSRSVVSFSGDHGPEGIFYISAQNSPDGKHYIAVANEISGTISVYEIQNVVSGINNQQHDQSSLIIYPNPAKGSEIYLNEEISGEILDITGKVILKVYKAKTINVSELPKGIYMLRTDEGFAKRFVIE